MKQRNFPIWSREKIQAVLSSDIAGFERMAAKENHQWLPSVLELMRELQSLCDAEPLDEMKLQQFVSRAKEHLIEQKLKGLGAIVWLAENLMWYANHDQ